MSSRSVALLFSFSVLIGAARAEAGDLISAKTAKAAISSTMKARNGGLIEAQTSRRGLGKFDFVTLYRRNGASPIRSFRAVQLDKHGGVGLSLFGTIDMRKLSVSDKPSRASTIKARFPMGMPVSFSPVREADTTRAPMKLEALRQWGVAESK